MVRNLFRVMALLFFVAFGVCGLVASSTPDASLMQKAECVIAVCCSLIGIGIVIRDFRKP